MPSRAEQSTEALPYNLSDVERVQLAARCALVTVEAARERLLLDLSPFKPGEPELVDGKPARLGGEPIDLLRWLVERIAGICVDGTFMDLIENLGVNADEDPVERFVEEVRDERQVEFRRRLLRELEPGN